MKPKECRYCEQTIEFEKYDQHVGYCGSRTKKCMQCNRNVCLKDEDSHQYGGECEAFREEDIAKRIEEQKRKEIEEKRKKEEEQRRIIEERKKIEAK